MGKSVLHYRRKMQDICGTFGKVSAWRNKTGGISYQVECLLCHVDIGNYPVRCRTGRVDYHTALRWFAVHMELVHTVGIVRSKYPVEITDDDRAIAERYLLRYAKQIGIANSLMKLWPEG